jgi:uncharacterized membrane protein
MNENMTNSPVGQVPYEDKSTNFVLGILSIVFAFLFSIVGLILGIIALNGVGKAQREGHPNSKDHTAKILAIIGIILSAVFMIMAGVMIATGAMISLA